MRKAAEEVPVGARKSARLEEKRNRGERRGASSTKKEKHVAPPAIVDSRRAKRLPSPSPPQPREPMPHPSAYSRASLLGLPGELRNQIYRYALVETGCIYVHKTLGAALEPGILRTCWQARQEATLIFRSENEFIMSIVDWSPQIPYGLDHWICNVQRLRSVLCEYTGRPNWANLKRWLQRAYAGNSMILPHKAVEPSESPFLQVPSRASAILWKTRGLKWEAVEFVLEEFRWAYNEKHGTIL